MSKFFFLFLLFFSIAIAKPSGKKVILGKVKSSHKGDQLTLTQEGKKAIVHWDSFSIGKKETVTFSQPTKDSSILNRVTGKGASKLLGNLKANGKVYLLNKNGILIGKSGLINAGAFIASTLNLTDEAFLKDRDLKFSGDSNASIVNQGKVLAESDIYFFAKEIENQGTLSAESVGLGAGQILLQEGSEERIFVCPDSEGKILNEGLIEATTTVLKAQGGNLYSLAINHTGVIEANTITSEKGRVILKAIDGETRVSGTINNRGETHLLGEEVRVKETAIVDASNSKKAGTVLVGGDYQGKNPNIQNAKSTHVEPGATILANGLETGDGGKVIVWGDDLISFYGQIQAKGGEVSGNGGFVEISSPKSWNASIANISVKTVDGKRGLLLIDPTDVTISGAASAPAITTPNYEPTGGSANLLNTDVETALGAGDFTILTSGDGPDTGVVKFDANVTWANGNVFSVFANSNIEVSTGITVSNTSAAASTTPVIVFDANNTITSTGTTTAGVIIEGTVSTLGSSISITGTGGDGAVANLYGIEVSGGTVSTVDGVITLEGTGAGTTSGNIGAYINATGTVTSGSGAINITGTGSTSGTTANHGIHINGGDITTTSGVITLTGTGGGSGASNIGIVVDTAGTVVSGSSDLNLTGTGSTSGSNTNHGININGGDVTTTSGVITLLGTGSGSGSSNIGILIDTVGTVVSDSSAIDLTGISSTLGTTLNHGINIDGAGSLVSTTTGNITLIGTGSGSGSTNIGILIDNSGEVASTGGSGLIDITGTGLAGTTDIVGVYLGGTGLGGGITSSVADITVTGYANGSSTGSNGVVFDTGGVITTTGAASVTVEGNAITGTEPGVHLISTGEIDAQGTGSVDITATGNGTANFQMADTSSLSSASGDITINTNTISLGGTATITSTGAGDFYLLPIAVTTNIGLGAGSGTLSVTNAELGTLSVGFGSVNFGRTDSGGTVDVDLGGLFTFLDPLVVNGKTITISSAASAGANAATFNIGTSGAGIFNLNGVVTAAPTTVNGGSNNDIFNINIAGQTATIDGMGGTNTLAGPPLDNDWNITGTDTGTLYATIAFSDIQNLSGNSAKDTFLFDLGTGIITGFINGAGGINTLDYTDFPSDVTVDLRVPSSTNIANIFNINIFIGGTSTNTLIGPNSITSWDISGADAGTVTPAGSGVITFSVFENLTGGNRADTFNFTGGSISGLIDGGTGGNNTIVGDATPNFWDLTAENTGTMNGNSFTNIQNLTGNTLNDTFTIGVAAGSISGTINGVLGGTNTLDYTGFPSAVTVNLAGPTATNVGTVLNIDTFVGSKNAGDNFIGVNSPTTWVFTGADTGTVGGTTAFSDFANVTGGTAVDIFDFTIVAGSISGQVDGGAGALNTILSPAIANTWTLTGTNAGDLNGNNFVRVQNLTGNTDTDDFVFMDGANITGTIDGIVGGANTFDYTSFSSPAQIDLTAMTATGAKIFLNIDTFVGNPAAQNTIKGPDFDNVWTTSALNAGTITNGYETGTQTFTDFENITGSAKNDIFFITVGGISGTLDGGYRGVNTLDYNTVPLGAQSDVNMATGSAPNLGFFKNINVIIGDSAFSALNN